LQRVSLNQMVNTLVKIVQCTLSQYQNVKPLSQRRWVRGDGDECGAKIM